MTVNTKEYANLVILSNQLGIEDIDIHNISRSRAIRIKANISSQIHQFASYCDLCYSLEHRTANFRIVK